MLIGFAVGYEHERLTRQSQTVWRFIVLSPDQYYVPLYTAGDNVGICSQGFLYLACQKVSDLRMCGFETVAWVSSSDRMVIDFELVPQLSNPIRLSYFLR